MKLYNGKQLAAAIGIPAVAITAMKASGYVFEFVAINRTSLDHALSWLREHPHWRYSDYIESKRKKPR